MRLLELLQVERLGAGEGLESELAEGQAATRVLDTDPGQRRVKVVAAVHEPGAGVDAVADGESSGLVVGPNASREPKGGVVHELDSLLVVLDLHDANDGTKALVPHDAHRVVDVDEDLRVQVGRALLVQGVVDVDQGLGALLNCLLDLTTDKVSCRCLDHRAEVGVGIEGVAKAVCLFFIFFIFLFFMSFTLIFINK